MKETGVIFNDEMVRAILEDRKTQTRRLMKIQPRGEDFQLLRVLSTTGPKRKEGKFYWALLSEDGLNILESDRRYFDCPYGQVGDRIYVREACYLFGRWTRNGLTKNGRQKWKFLISPCKSVVFEKPKNIAQRSARDGFDGDYGFKYTPGMHMPRWASRITLEITDIRVERLQDISEADANAEGLFSSGWSPSFNDPDNSSFADSVSAKEGFTALWDSIYGPESWAANPWVWAIEYKKVT